MRVAVKDRFGDELEVKVVVTPEDMKTKAVEIKCDGTMSYKIEDLGVLIETLQKAREAIS